MEQNVALIVAVPLRRLVAVGSGFAHDGCSADRVHRSLWQDFTPHRLIRRYSEYAWLNKPASPPLAS